MSFKTQDDGNKNWQGKHKENSTSSFLYIPSPKYYKNIETTQLLVWSRFVAKQSL